jgi:hypothetical protein
LRCPHCGGFGELSSVSSHLPLAGCVSNDGTCNRWGVLKSKKPFVGPVKSPVVASRRVELAPARGSALRSASACRTVGSQMRHRVRFHPGPAAASSTASASPRSRNWNLLRRMATAKLNHTTSASNHALRRRNIVCDVPVESLESVTCKHLRSAGHAGSCSAPGFVLQEGGTETRDAQPEKAKFVLAQGASGCGSTCEIMQLVLMSVGERLAPPFNRVQAEADPSFRRAPPDTSPKGCIIVAQPAAAGRVGLELNSESR